MAQSLFAGSLPEALDHLRGVGPVLAGLIDAMAAPEIANQADPFLALLSAIVNQQLSGKAADTIERRVLSLFHGAATPAVLLSIPEEALRGAGLSGQKTRYLRDLAEQAASGMLDLERLTELADEQVIVELTRVKGIGRWTAQMFLIFCLGRTDVLPAGDLGLRTALRRHYGLPDLPDSVLCEEIGSAWRPYRSVATLYLWRSLRASPGGEVNAAATEAGGVTD